MNFLIYLLQVSACTAVFYLFYYLFLSKFTFFVLNRWYLLGSIFLSFVIPLVHISVGSQLRQMPVMQQIVYVNTLQVAPQSLPNIQIPVATENPIDWILLFKISYLTIVSVLAFHLIVTLIILFKKLSARKVTKVGSVNILYNQPKLPNGSFFNYIFLNDQELSADERQQIIAHEMLHVKLYHSIDRMIVKIAQIILWFNPFIYFFSKSIEENHEFEVDHEITQVSDKKIYANLLLHLSIAGKKNALYHNFSKVPLKKRITLLFNKPSTNMKKAIYVLIVPVVLVSCLAFAKLKNDLKPVEKENKAKLFSKLKPDDNLYLNKQDKSERQDKSNSTSSTIKLNTVAYRQKVKRMPDDIKQEEKNKAYRQTDDFKQKEKLSKDVMGKTITVKIKSVKKDNNDKIEGFFINYNNNEYLMRTKFGQEKQLNNLLKVGDEITLKVFGDAFGPGIPIMIQPAFIYKDNVKIFQLAEADKIPSYPFLYERNKVRFVDGQITHIQKYPNGKWKSARLEIVNGYQFTLNFKPTAPNFDQIEDSDHVRLRFVNEVKTSAKTYQINDWVALSTDIKDYGIKNPDFFYKFYTPI